MLFAAAPATSGYISIFIYKLFHRPLLVSAPHFRFLEHSAVADNSNMGMYTEREVRKATRDLTNLLTGIETPLSRLEAVQTKYTELLGRMKRLDQENAKNKKRGDLFQKEKEAQRTELTKTVSMKEKLEKLCRELTRENKKVKVSHTTHRLF